MAFTDSLSEKQAMVFIHGLPTSKELFTKVAALFSESFRVISVDLIDYGESDKIERHIEHKERAQNLRSFFMKLKLKDIVLVSHDLGASVAIDVMGLCPELIDRLVLMSPPVYPDFVEPAVVKIVRSKIIGSLLIALMKNYLLSRSVKKGLYNKMNYNRYLKTAIEKAFKGKAGNAALLRNLRWGKPAQTFADYPTIIKSITQKVLILQGVNDPYIPVEQAHRLHQDIENSSLVLLDHASHFLPIDVPEIIYLEMNAFLKE